MDRVIFFIDARNILGGRDTHREKVPGYDFGYKELSDYLKSEFKVIRGYYYDGAPHHSQWTEGKRSFFSLLRKTGITLRLKEIDFAAAHPSQKGVDIFLTADMISLAYEDAYDTAVLLSGDGDYVALVDLVKSKGKRVIVMAFNYALSQRLKECADEVRYMESIPQIQRMTTKSSATAPVKRL